jgi:hypothetical protein
MEWIAAIVAAILAILKGLFGIDKPQKDTVEHAEPEIEIDDGKTDEERLRDLGL